MLEQHVIGWNGLEQARRDWNRPENAKTKLQDLFDKITVLGA